MKPSAFLLPLLPLLSCAACVPITPLTSSVDARVVTLARTSGGVDTINACTPPSPPAPPTPDQWWNAVAPGQPPKAAGLGVVGFNLWRNGADSCTEFRQDSYRSEFAYPLAPLRSLQGLVTHAELGFSSAVLPALRPGFGCELRTAAAAAVLGLPPAAPPPASFDCRAYYRIGPLVVTHL